MSVDYDDVLNDKISDDIYMKQIAARIERRRIEQGMSYQDLASKTKMSKSTLQRYASGAIKNIPLSKIETLATALEVSPDWILGWSDDAELPKSYVVMTKDGKKEFDLSKVAKAIDVLLKDAQLPMPSLKYENVDSSIYEIIRSDKLQNLLCTDENIWKIIDIYFDLNKVERDALLSMAKTLQNVQNSK